MDQKILAIDDEPHMLELLERIIQEKTSYQIKTTPNALEVPELLDQVSYDLIISDFRMPGMDGLELLRLLQEQGRPELMILITAFGEAGTAAEAWKCGVFDYLTKPFRKERLLHAVERAMGWQLARRRAEELEQIFATCPYTAARQAFDREYVRRLASSTQEDLAEMQRRSGLSAEDLRALQGSDSD